MTKKNPRERAAATAASFSDVGELADVDAIERDRKIAEVLRELGPGSEEWVDYALKLRAFGFATLARQFGEGVLLTEVARKTGFSMPPLLPCWSSDDVASIIGWSTSMAAEPFMESAITNGGWDPDKKTKITTFFVNRAYYRFADDYRSVRDSDAEAQRELLGDAQFELDAVRYVHLVQRSEDPEQTVVNRAQIRRILGGAGLHQRIGEILFLRSNGWSYVEIGQKFGVSADSVRKAVSEFHKKISKTDRGTR